MSRDAGILITLESLTGGDRSLVCRKDQTKAMRWVDPVAIYGSDM